MAESAKDKLLAMKSMDLGAPLKSSQPEEKPEEPKEPTSKPKHLNAMPTAYSRAYEQGKVDGVITVDFSQYIYAAVREKLQKDGLI